MTDLLKKAVKLKKLNSPMPYDRLVTATPEPHKIANIFFHVTFQPFYTALHNIT